MAIGPRTRQLLHLQPGDKLPGAVLASGVSSDWTVVGVVALPSGQRNMSEALNAGDGLLVSAAEDDLTGSVTNTGGNAWVTFNPAVARDDVIRQLTGPDAFPGRMTIPTPPADVENLTRIRRTPGLLAGLIGAMAAAALAHALTTTVRRRRREFGCSGRSASPVGRYRRRLAGMRPCWSARRR